MTSSNPVPPTIAAICFVALLVVPSTDAHTLKFTARHLSQAGVNITGDAGNGTHMGGPENDNISGEAGDDIITGVFSPAHRPSVSVPQSAIAEVWQGKQSIQSADVTCAISVHARVQFTDPLH
jgi:hypothetical protein